MPVSKDYALLLPTRPWPNSGLIVREGYNREGGVNGVDEDVLPEGTAEVASALAQWPAMDQFYLAGGTALALHLGHRRSRDLDFFTRDPVGTLPPLIGWDDAFRRFARVQWDLKTKEQIQWRIDDVSVTLWAYPFTHRFGYHSWRGLAVADARDLAIHKAYTLGRRAQARDYLDLHAVLTAGILSLGDLIGAAQETYQDAFSARLFVQQLTYTQDLPDRDSALSLLVTPQSFDLISEDLERCVQIWARERFEGPES